MFKKKASHKEIIITTLDNFNDIHVEHVKVLNANIVVGANILKDLFAKVTDTVGGRSTSYEIAYNAACEYAKEELQKQAFKAGANAVLKVEFEFSGLGKNNTILAAHATGTAVILHDD